jgi:hypothetical protein
LIAAGLQSCRGSTSVLFREGRLPWPGGTIGNPAQPLTVVLVEASSERSSGRCERTNAAGLPVVEIVFDSDGGRVDLPAPPYKLVRGADPVDRV